MWVLSVLLVTFGWTQREVCERTVFIWKGVGVIICFVKVQGYLNLYRCKVSMTYRDTVA